MYAKKNSGKKVIVMLLAIALLIGGAIGGTVAYLMTQSAPVTNTFVAGRIGGLNLTETDTDPDTPAEDHEYTVIPGVPIVKDPKLSFNSHNVDAFVFIKIDHQGWALDNGTYSNVGGKVTWSIAEGWTKLSDTNTNRSIYWRKVAKTDYLDEVSIIKDNCINVDTSITQTELNSDACEVMTFTAYAIQADGMQNAGAAWAALGNPQ